MEMKLLGKEVKKRYKMYKAGKHWVTAPIVFLGMAMGIEMGGSHVAADTVQTNNNSQASANQSVSQVAQQSSVKTSKEVTLSSSTAAQKAPRTMLAAQPQTAAKSSSVSSSQAEKSSSAATSSSKQSTQLVATSEAAKSSSAKSNSTASSKADSNKSVATQTDKTSASTSSKSSSTVSSASSVRSQKAQQAEQHDNAIQVKKNGKWYLQNKESKRNYTGFQFIKDQNKTVYYNPQSGAMVYGQQKINNNWYYFDKVTGAMKFGYYWIKEQQKEVYYDPNKGNMVYGQQKIDGKWQYFDKKTGKQIKSSYYWIKEQNKEVYYDHLGNMVYGQQKINGKWQYFNRVTGAQAKSQYIWIADQNKEVYYDRLGNMVYGQQKIDGKWQYFDTITGAQAKNQFVNIKDQNKTVYYDDLGNMVYGPRTINGGNYLFDLVTGALIAYKGNELPASLDSASMNQVDGYLTWDGWFRPTQYHQNGKTWVNSGVTDWRPYLMYAWPSKDVEAQYIQYFVNNGYADSSLGLTKDSVKALSKDTPTQILNNYASNLRDSIEKEIYKDNYSTAKLSNTMKAFMLTIPDFSLDSELPVETHQGYKPEVSGTIDDDQITFVNNDSHNQKEGNTAYADSNYRLMNHTIINQYGGQDVKEISPELLVGTDIDNSNPIVQAENLNWEYFLLHYSTIQGQGDDGNFDGFRVDAADNIDTDVLMQMGQLMNDMYHTRENNANADNHLVYNEGYHSTAAQMLNQNGNQQLYMDSDLFNTFRNVLANQTSMRNNIGDLASNSIVNRWNDTTENQATPNWSFVNNHDQIKNIINQIIVDEHPGQTDIMANGYKPEYATQAWEEYYKDEAQTNKKYALYNVPAQYALLLTNKDTVPQVYYGDMFKETDQYMQTKGMYYDAIATLLKARKKYVAGGQSMTAFGDDLIASVRYGKGIMDKNQTGNDAISRTSGIAVIVGNNQNMVQNTITVSMGKEHANQKYNCLIGTTDNGLSYNGQSLWTDGNGDLHITVKGYANPYVSGYLSVWVPDGAAADQDATTTASTAKNTSGKTYQSNAALDSHVIYEDFSLYQPYADSQETTAYVQIANHAQDFKDLGITDFWFAPPYQSFDMSRYHEGYAVTDRYDLGHSKATKYGTDTQMIAAVKALHKVGIKAQVDIVLNQMLGLSGKEVVTGTRTDNYGNQMSVDGQTFKDKLYMGYVDGGGQGQQQYGGAFLDQLKQMYPDLFTTKAGSTGVAPDPSVKITSWLAKYENGTSLQSSGMGTVAQREDGTYYYLNDGKTATAFNTTVPTQFTQSDYWVASAAAPGWQTYGSNKYYILKDGTMALGHQKINGKDYYFNPEGGQLVSIDGKMADGQRKVNGKWQYVNPVTGKQARNCYVWLASQNKEVYYDKNGNMVYGQQKIDGKWQYFDKVTGAQLKDSYLWIKEQNKEVYYDKDGNMVYGQQLINNHWQYFDPVTGAQAKNRYVWIKGQNKEVYYDGLGNMVYGQKQINGKWQYFDTTTGKQAKNQYIHIASQNKWVYYDKDGNMVYGQQKINGKWQYFDKVTGAQVKQQYLWIPEQNKEVYYDKGGNMVYGWQVIDGHTQYFDPITGAQVKNITITIDGKSCTFDAYGNLVD